MTPSDQPRRALRLPAVCDKTGMKRTQVYTAVRAGAFPKPFRLSDVGRAVGWDEAEVDQYLADRMARR
jgi:prophage regulatory protein